MFPVASSVVVVVVVFFLFFFFFCILYIQECDKSCAGAWKDCLREMFLSESVFKTLHVLSSDMCRDERTLSLLETH